MKGKWILIAVIILLCVWGLAYWTAHNFLKQMNQTQNAKIPQGSYLVIKLSGSIPEFTQVSMGFFGQEQPSAFEIKQKILRAANDNRIKGIILEPNGVMVGYASAHEITSALDKFKSKGKKVYSYLQMGATKDYFLCAGSDKIFMNPSESGGVMFTGIGANITLMKDFLDKIGITLHVAQAGKFKGYTDLYTKNTLSPELRSDLTNLFGDVYKTLTSDLAKDRKLSDEKMKWIFEQREDLFMTGKVAKSYGLVDSLIYEDDLYETLGIPKEKRLKISNYQIYLKPQTGDRVAVIYANGSIMPNNGNWNAQTINAKEFKETLDKVKEDTNVKAIVLRINSPGGSSLESDIILNQLRKFKNVPIVISMGDVDASGGYYISTIGQYIYADPYTITGSIGVVAMLPKFDKLGKKIGVHTESITFGKFTDIYDPWSPMNPTTMDALQRSTDTIYNEFKNYVGNSRKLSPEEVEAVAQGQVWSAERAKNNRLIDEVGTLDDAVKKAADLAKLKEINVVYYPKQQSIFDVILREKLNRGAFSSYLQHLMAKEFGTEQALRYKEMFISQPLQMILPFVPEF
jgi:protease IV